MGTNNTDKELGTLDYAIEMIDACGLEPDGFFKPEKMSANAFESIRRV